MSFTCILHNWHSSESMCPVCVTVTTAPIRQQINSDAAKPWPFNGYAPGNYSNTCTTCEKHMRGVDKLCFTCLECAVIGGQQLIEALKSWKRQAIAVMPPIQEIGKAIGVKLGESIHDKILPAIERLSLELDIAMGLNRTYREVLEKIEQMSDSGSYEKTIIDMKKIANEALNHNS